MPEIDPRKIHVSKEELNKWTKQYKALQEIRVNEGTFAERVAQSQWITKYLISAEGCHCNIIEN